MKHEGKDRFDSVCRVAKKRRSRGATKRSIVAWLQSLKGEEKIFNALIDRLIQDVFEWR
jgi:hypothetical protein